MRIRAFAVLVLACWTFAASSSLPKHPGFIGILGHDGSNTAPEQAAFQPAIPLRTAPNIDSPIIGELEDISSAEAYEWSYEDPGLAVYSYVHDGATTWYKIYASELDQFAWIGARADLTFHGLSGLVTNSLSYMTNEWNKFVYSDPTSLETASELNAHGDEVPIEVASTAIVAGKLWVLVVVLKESPCASAEVPRVLGSGWVPAVSENSQLNIWFYSRGC